MDSHMKKATGIRRLALRVVIPFILRTVAFYIGIGGMGAAYATPTPMGSVLCDVLSMCYGNMGQALSVMAVIVIGVGASIGKTSWGMALTVGIGIGVFWGAPTIIYDFTGIAACS
jgi:type IV secretory pathway VirB2 component (pilin)